MKTKLLAAILIVIQLGCNNYEQGTIPLPLNPNDTFHTELDFHYSRARTSAFFAFEKLAEENKVHRTEFKNFMNAFDSVYTRK
jgi:hypothetical protein